MLYIKFKISETEKFEDFRKLYKHMLKVRQPNFEFDEPILDNIDWSTMKDEDYDALFDDNSIEYNRYKALFPEYTTKYFDKHTKHYYPNSSFEDSAARALLNYIEFGFEVDFNELKAIDDESGVVKFSTSNFPFGGLDRFILVLNAYGLRPQECFDGFNIFEFIWESEFEYESEILPIDTRKYLDKHLK